MSPPATSCTASPPVLCEEQGFLSWAPRVGAAETVTVDWDGEPRQVPKTVILTQVINHATEHRAQVTAMLTQLGIEPPELAGWTYFGSLQP